jgi:hypothetical protein
MASIKKNIGEIFMNITEIEKEIESFKNAVNTWPSTNVTDTQDRNTVLELTDNHFRSIESNLEELLRQCKMLNENDQILISPSLKELKTFVEAKLNTAQNELIETKNRIDQGRNYAQAIRAYTKI